MAREPKCPIANMVCPRNGDPRQGKYCPAWTEIAETNTATGEERITKDCWFRLAPRFMTEVIKASNRPAAAVERMSNDVAAGFAGMANAVLPAMMRIQEHASQIEYQNGSANEADPDG